MIVIFNFDKRNTFERIVSRVCYKIVPVYQLNVTPILDMKVQIITETVGTASYRIEDVAG